MKAEKLTGQESTDMHRRSCLPQAKQQHLNRQQPLQCEYLRDLGDLTRRDDQLNQMHRLSRFTEVV